MSRDRRDPGAHRAVRRGGRPSLVRRVARQVGRTVGRLGTLPSRAGRRVPLAVGVAALVAAGGVALLPAAVVDAIVAPASDVATRTAAARAAAAVVAAGVGLLAASAAVDGDDARPWAVGDPPERAHVATRDTVGRAIDDPLADLAADLPERQRVSKRWRVRSRVSAAAVEVLVAEGDDPDAARDRLATGAWTDDPRAAAFLGDVRLPLGVRVRDWLAGDPFGRRARAAVDAVEARAATGARRGAIGDGDPSPADDAPDAARYGSLAADLGVRGDDGDGGDAASIGDEDATDRDPDRSPAVAEEVSR